MKFNQSFLKGFSDGFLMGFKKGKDGGGGGGDDTNRGRVWNWLIAKGFTTQAAAGVVGNAMQESQCDPTAEEGPSPGYGYGIFQWTGDRRVAFEAAAEAAGVPKSDFDFQMNYFWNEAHTTEAWGFEPYGGIDNMMLYTDIDQMTIDFEAAYLRAGEPNMPARLQYAHDAYNAYA